MLQAMAGPLGRMLQIVPGRRGRMLQVVSGRLGRIARLTGGGLALVTLVLLGGCGKVHDVALELHPASEAAALVPEEGPVQTLLAAGELDCAADYLVPVEALCVQVYTRANDRIVMEADCHDAPQLGSNDDLAAFLRGLGSIADGIPQGEGTDVYLRLLGYRDAARQDLQMCGVSASLPGHLDETTSPPSLALYLLCRPQVRPSEANTAFEDYCGSIDFVALFP